MSRYGDDDIDELADAELKEEEGEDTHREQEGTKHVAYRSRRLRERNSNPHSLRQSAGQRGGDSEREPTAYSIW